MASNETIQAGGDGGHGNQLHFARHTLDLEIADAPPRHTRCARHTRDSSVACGTPGQETIVSPTAVAFKEFVLTQGRELLRAQDASAGKGTRGENDGRRGGGIPSCGPPSALGGRFRRSVRSTERTFEVQVGAATDGGQGHADACGSQRPQVPVEFRQGRDFSITDLADEIAFAKCRQPAPDCRPAHTPVT